MIPSRIYRKLHLYRRSRLQASLVILAVCLAVTLAAGSFQRHSAHKLRATAVLELTTDASGKVSSRVIPVAILDNGRFHDASIYESRPRPMALANGVIYEAQKSGVPVGYATIFAGEKDLGSWIAAGSWQSVTQAASAPPPPSPSQSPAASGDERPILHRGGVSPPDAPRAAVRGAARSVRRAVPIVGGEPLDRAARSGEAVSVKPSGWGVGD